MFNYIEEAMAPISIVEKDAFKKLVHGLSRGQNLPCRKTTLDALKTRHQKVISNLIDAFNQTEYVCTTADIWSSNHKSYLGVTGHYIDDSLKRHSVVLACRRMKYSHTYFEIGTLLSSIHTQFNLSDGKLIGTVTDNATNFAKSFKIYSVSNNISSAEEHDIDFLNDEVQNLTTVNYFPDFDSLQTETDDTENDDVTLPQHFRCCSHTLNLIATTDIDSALKDQSYKKLYYSTFGKLTALWNICHRSTSASDEIERICHYKLIVPCPTRWNSLYDSVTRILALKEFLSSICEALKKPKLKSTELEFLEEYRRVMECLATAIDILQGENSCFLGYVLPSLLQVKQSLQSLTHLVYCEPLKNAILEGITKRFCKILDLKDHISKQYILATVSLPKFKLRWLAANDGNYQAVKTLFLAEMEKVYKSLYEYKEQTCDSPETEDDDSFFKILTNPSVSNSKTEDEQLRINQSPPSICTMQLLQYLNDKARELESLRQYNIICEIFKKYNTILPSSAPVERLFSTGGQLLTPRRNRLSDEHFEVLLMLNKNGTYK